MEVKPAEHSFQKKRYIVEVVDKHTDTEKLNSGCHFTHTPFIIDDDKKMVTVDENWFFGNKHFWEFFLTTVRQLKYKLEFGNIPIPHQDQEGSEALHKLYVAYRRQFHYPKWLLMLATPLEIHPFYQMYEYDDKPRFLLPLPDFIAKALTEISYQRIRKKTEPKPELLEQIEGLRNVLNEVTTKLKKMTNCYGFFVKNHHKSCKNNTWVVPLKDTEAIITTLTTSEDIYYSWIEDEPDANFLIVMPFDYQCKGSREFRMIILNRKVAAITQQQWWRKLEWVPDDECIENLIKLWEEDLVTKIIYNDVVLDVFLDEKKKAHLIECNTGGIWGASGSGLFHWIHDLDKILSDTIYVRLYFGTEVNKEPEKVAEIKMNEFS